MDIKAIIVVDGNALHDIEKDETFGYRLAHAIRQKDARAGDDLHVPAGTSAKAATVLATHELQHAVVVTSDNHLTKVQVVSAKAGPLYAPAGVDDLLREWAAQRGYDLVPSRR